MNRFSAWSLYVMIAEVGNQGLFKIGIASNVAKRVLGVQTGCPYPIKKVLAVSLPSKRLAMECEHAFHFVLAEYQSSGEWFAFDLTNKDHKRIFREACLSVLDPCLGRGWKWVQADIDGLKNAVKALKDRSKRYRDKLDLLHLYRRVMNPGSKTSL